MPVTISGSGTIGGLSAYQQGAGLTLITSQSFSAVSSVSVNNCFTSAYDNYRVVIRGTGSGTIGYGIDLRMRSSGADATGSDYIVSFVYNTTTAGPVKYYSTADSAGSIGGEGNNGMWFSLDILSPAVASRTECLFQSGYASTATINYHSGMWQHALANPYDGFTVMVGAGTITGTIRVYGYTN